MFPTRTTVHLVAASVLLLGAGVASRDARLIGFGISVLLGIEAARAAAALRLARARSAGLEMTWHADARVLRAVRGQTVVVEAELRNRHPRPLGFRGLRAVASNALRIAVEPHFGVLPAASSLIVRIEITPRRIGRHGVHGLALEAIPTPGLFQTPLAFGYPLGIEVLPRPLAVWLGSARGGRARHSVAHGPSPSLDPGDEPEVRELREYTPGDPMNRIAWKASARRGRLISRELERDERQLVWLLLDASVELWGGDDGRAPLDRAIDEAAASARRMLSQGDRVGLGVVAGSRMLAWLAPASGPAHAARLAAALVEATATLDADRSELDEGDVSRLVIEHAALLDPRTAANLDPRELDRVATAIEPLFARAPFAGAAPPAAPSARERRLRQYLASFGIASPARQEADGARTEQTLSRALAHIAEMRERPASVLVFGPCAGPPGAALTAAVERLRRKGVRVAVRPIEVERAATFDPRDPSRSSAVVGALARRAQLARANAERHLRRLGVRIMRRPAIEAR